MNTLRRAAAIAATVLVSAAVASCTASPATSPTTSSAPGTTATFADTPCWSPNYPGVPQLDLGPQFRCGYLTVPQNRSKPGGKTIKVAVAIAKAASATPQKDPVLYLNGGPGGTAIVSATQWVKGGMNADRDAIFIDQRGTYHADPSLTCTEADAFGNRLATLRFFDPATKTAAEAAMSACREKFTAAGWDISAYNTEENAADVADLRVALGVSEWNIYGVSYGTYLALTVLRERPQGVRSVVLDSVVPPQENTQVGFWTWAALGYEHLFDACARQPACQAAYPTLRTDLTTAVNALEKNPATVTITTPSGPKQVIVDGFSVANAVVLPSLSPGLMQDLPRTIHAAANGDASLVAKIVGSDGSSGAVGWGLSLGVFCSEQVAYVTSAQAFAEAKKALPAFPDSVLTPRVTQAPTLAWDCATWNVPKATPDPHQAVSSDVPALVLAGTLDAVTPRENARSVLPGLSRSQYVEVPGSGHDAVLWQAACVQPLMNAFLLNPTRPVDAACVKSLSDPTFTTS